MHFRFVPRLKTFISISLLILFISNSVFKAAIIFNYWQNTEAIIASCCINKNKPELNCKGKCYVGSELNKVNTKNESNSTLRILMQDFEMIVHPLSERNTFITLTLSNYWIMKNTAEYKSEWMNSIFHPPTC